MAAGRIKQVSSRPAPLWNSTTSWNVLKFGSSMQPPYILENFPEIRGFITSHDLQGITYKRLFSSPGSWVVMAPVPFSSSFAKRQKSSGHIQFALHRKNPQCFIPCPMQKNMGKSWIRARSCLFSSSVCAHTADSQTNSINKISDDPYPSRFPKHEASLPVSTKDPTWQGSRKGHQTHSNTIVLKPGQSQMVLDISHYETNKKSYMEG